MSSLVPSAIKSPEQREMEEKRRLLDGLESDFATRQLEYSTLAGEIGAFRNHYYLRVGSLYARLDAIRVDICNNRIIGDRPRFLIYPARAKNLCSARLGYTLNYLCISVKTTMNLIVSKWGNSLAVRIPAEVARELALKEGAVVECATTSAGTLELVPADKTTRDKRLEKHFARVNKRLAKTTMTTPASRLLREEDRY